MQDQQLVSTSAQLQIRGLLLRTDLQLQRQRKAVELMREEQRQKRCAERRHKRMREISHTKRVRRRERRLYQGLAHLLALGASPEMQQIIASGAERGGRFSTAHITKISCPIIYAADRPSGDAWDGLPGAGCQMVTISFLPTALCLTRIYIDVSEEDFLLPYTSTETEQRNVLRSMCGTLECGSLRIPTRDGDARLARIRRQRKWEWEPESLLIQVLVECSVIEELQRYFGEMLTNMSR